MKKIILVIAITMCSLTSFAQKSSWYVGGQVGFNSGSKEITGQPDIKSNDWSFAPEVGTFLKDNLQLGVALNISGASSDTNDYSETKVAPVLYLRRFFKLTDNFSTFAGVVGSFTTGSVEQNGIDGDISGAGINLSIGAAYALSPRFTAVAQYGLFGYTSETTEIGGVETKDTNFGLNVNTLGPVFNVGIYYTFKK